MQFLKTNLEQQLLVALFLTIVIGYLVGKISIAALVPKPRIASGEPGLERLEIAVSNREVIGKRLYEVKKSLPVGVQITEVRENHHDRFVSPEIVLTERIVLLAVSSSREALEQARTRLSKTAENS